MDTEIRTISNTISDEKKIMEWYKQNNPELLNPLPITEKGIFDVIGIKTYADRVPGYIRHYPADFIVEEVPLDGRICMVEPTEQGKKISPSFPAHIGCNLVKVGISTYDALNLLAKVLGIKPGRITYAGLKDVNALTSQRIVFLDANAELFEKIKAIQYPNLFLTNFSVEQKGLSLGELKGNRFTIFLRTNGETDKQWLFKNLVKIKQRGFLNFYFTQRFGVPRFTSHILGKLILEKKYQETIFTFFTKPGLQETPLIKSKRKEAEKYFGDWKKMEEIFSELPFTFRNELQLLPYLKENPDDYLGALIFFKDQTKFWVYAYSSYLFNQVLSSTESNLPEKLPLLLSDHPEDREVYRSMLEKDGIINLYKSILPFRFLELARRFVKTRVLPDEISVKIVPEGVALSFILDKGAYATAFLSNFFEIKDGMPLPEWVSGKEYDTKKLLGIGSTEAVNKIFGENLSSRITLL